MMQSMTSAPLATSMTWERRALALSRVIMMGGLGLFLDPVGLPLGRRWIWVSPPSPPPEMAAGSLLSAAESSVRSRFMLGLTSLLLPLCSASELGCCCCC